MLISTLETETFFPTEIASQTLTSLNPSASAPKSLSLSFLENNRRNRMKVMRYSDTTVESIDLTEQLRRKRVGVSSPLGQGFWLNASAEYTERENAGTNSNSFLYARSPGREAFSDTSTQAGLTLQLSQAIRMGAQMRVLWTKADVVGSYYVGNDDRTTYKGSLTAFHTGLTVEVPGGSGGLIYLTPARGKVSIQGESKITSRPGLFLGTLHGDVWKTLRLGFSYGLWQHDKDELARRSTTPIRSNDYSPRGLNSENELYLLNQMMLGFDMLPSDRWGFSLFGIRNAYAWQFDPDAKPEKQTESKNRGVGYGIRTAFQLKNQSLLAQIGADWARRKTYPSPYESLQITHSSTDWSYFFQVQASL